MAVTVSTKAQLYKSRRIGNSNLTEPSRANSHSTVTAHLSALRLSHRTSARVARETSKKKTAKLNVWTNIIIVS